LQPLYIHTVFEYSASQGESQRLFADSPQQEFSRGVLKMKTIQKWFEQLAGISQDELDRLALAAEVFSEAPFDASDLQKPACWRRKSRYAKN
jgi:hypothetical protein